VASILGATAFGCHKAQPIENADEESQQLAADGNESSAASAQSTNIGNLVFASVTKQDPAAAATDVASAPKLWPSGCVTRVKDAQNPLLVHITFAECTGPFGLVHLTGGEDVTFSKSPAGMLHADFQSVNLTANGKPVTHTASADIIVMGNDRQIDWNGHWQRVNERGDEIQHDSQLTILVDVLAGCRTANGTATTAVATREVGTTVKDYEVCRNAATGVDGCPTGVVTHTHKATGKTVTIDFDGSTEATVNAVGKTFELPLICGT
jgi:hypothetical protein